MSGLSGMSGLSVQPFGGAGGLVPFGFDPDEIVFTPSMAKRSTSVFAASPIIQGKFDGSGVPDVLSLSRGTVIHGSWYDNFDPEQGTIIKWWTAELDRDASHTNDEYIWYISANYNLRYEHDNQLLVAVAGGQSFSASLTTSAATLYNISVSWDCNRPIDGTNYGRVGINDAYTYGASTQPTASAPGSSIYIGSNAGTTLPVNAMLEGLHISRRVWFDGAYGTALQYDDSGPIDELNAVYS